MRMRLQKGIRLHLAWKSTRKCFFTDDDRSVFYLGWLKDPISNWSTWLAEGDDPEKLELLRRNIEKGLPHGKENFIRELEKLVGRLLRYRPLGHPRSEKGE